MKTCNTFLINQLLAASYCIIIFNHGIISVIGADYHRKQYIETRYRRSHNHVSSLSNKANSISDEVKMSFSFLTPNGTKVQAQSGGSALLPCAVKRTNQGMVVWIRRRDRYLLSVGTNIYATDERFHVEHIRHLGHWPLKIKSVKLEDSGTYECQISTHPPAAIFVHLEVIEAFAEILGPIDLYIKTGSTLRLVCRIKDAVEAPEYIFWYHSGRMVNYDTDQGFIVTDGKNISILTVQEVDKSIHDGNYTCAPSNARPAVISTHILNGEIPAAMQHAQTSSAIHKTLPNIIYILIGLYIVMCHKL